jgi:hypothetical protein
MSDSDAPVRDTLAVMTAASIENSDLSAREHMIARIAALIAVDAPSASYALNVEVAADSGITLDDIQDILVAVAPIVGAPRVGSAITRMAKGLGLVIEMAAEALAEAEAEEEAAAEAV